MLQFSTDSPAVAGRGRIVVGYDGSEHATRALRWAANESHERDIGLHVVSCWHFPAWVEPFPYQAPFSGEEFEQRSQDELVSGVEALELTEPLDVSAQVLDGPAAVRLLEFGETAKMIVVGSRGRTGFSGLLLGSVSRHLSEHAQCPVVIIH